MGTFTVDMVFGQQESGFHLVKVNIHEGDWDFQGIPYSQASRNNRSLYFKGEVKRITINYEKKYLDGNGDTFTLHYSPCTYIFDENSQLIYAHTQTYDAHQKKEINSYRYEYFRNTYGELIGFTKLDNELLSSIHTGHREFLESQKNNENSNRVNYYFIEEKLNPVQIFSSHFEYDSIFQHMSVYENTNDYGGKSTVFTNLENPSTKYLLEFDSTNLLRKSSFNGFTVKRSYKLDNHTNIIEVNLLNEDDGSFHSLEKINYEIVYRN